MINPATGDAKEIQAPGRTLAEAKASVRAQGLLIEGESAFPESVHQPRRAQTTPNPEPINPTESMTGLDPVTIKRLAEAIGWRVLITLLIYTLMLPVIALVFALLWALIAGGIRDLFFDPIYPVF